MAQIIDISGNLDDPVLSTYRTLRRPMDHFRERIFVAEGENVVRRLLDSSLPIRSLLLTPQWHQRLESLPRLTGEEITIYRAPQELLETIVGFHLHQGIMAVAEMPDDPDLEELLGRMGNSGLVVAMDGLVNAENVGVIVRNCAGFGVGLLIAGETSSSPYLRRSVRNSMGTIFSLPVIHVPCLSESLRSLHSRYGYAIHAADPAGEAVLYHTDMTGKTCIVVGNEGNGLSTDVLAACTSRMAIPMANGTDSLNVANATAVILSEVLRQRRYGAGR